MTKLKQKLNLWQSSKTQIGTKSKNLYYNKLNSNGDKTKKKSNYDKAQTHLVIKLNSKCDNSKIKNSNCDKAQNLNCDKTQKLKSWQFK